jgi:hypothetical protein
MRHNILIVYVMYCYVEHTGGSGSGRASASQKSFRLKLLHRENYKDWKFTKNSTVKCQVCDQPSPHDEVQGAHFCDITLRDTLVQAAMKNSGQMPLSINDFANGMLLCKSCHGYFDNSSKHLLVNGDGVIVCSKSLQKHAVYKALHGTQVPWAARIGTKVRFVLLASL